MGQSERELAVRRCYQQALTMLRQRHDEEFHELLHDVYEKNGVQVRKRKSRIQSKKEKASE